MADLRIRTSGEFDVAEVQGLSDDGIEFVDSFVSEPMTVLDAGRIVVPVLALIGLRERAEVGGLAIEEEDS